MLSEISQSHRDKYLLFFLNEFPSNPVYRDRKVEALLEAEEKGIICSFNMTEFLLGKMVIFAEG